MGVREKACALQCNGLHKLAGSDGVECERRCTSGMEWRPSSAVLISLALQLRSRRFLITG